MTTTMDEDRARPAMDDIDALMLHLFWLVAEGLSKATCAFLANDRDAARKLIAADTEFDTLQEEIEELVERELTTVDGRLDHLHMLLSVVRIVPELERSGDLVEHIALRTSLGLFSKLTPASRALIAQMAEIGVEMWRAAASAYASRDWAAADRLRHRDDAIDDLHVRLTAELGAGSLSPAVAIEMGLVARFYERLGDHAVNVIRRMPRSSAVPLVAS